MKAHLAGDALARKMGDSAGFTRRFEAVMHQVRKAPNDTAKMFGPPCFEQA